MRREGYTQSFNRRMHIARCANIVGVTYYAQIGGPARNRAVVRPLPLGLGSVYLFRPGDSCAFPENCAQRKTASVGGCLSGVQSQHNPHSGLEHIVSVKSITIEAEVYCNARM